MLDVQSALRNSTPPVQPVRRCCLIAVLESRWNHHVPGDSINSCLFLLSLETDFEGPAKSRQRLRHYGLVQLLEAMIAENRSCLTRMSRRHANHQSADFVIRGTFHKELLPATGLVEEHVSDIPDKVCAVCVGGPSSHKY